MFTLVETLMKIKASLTVLVGNNHQQLHEIQNQYLKQATITIDSIQESQNESFKTEFLKFLERDEREIMRTELENVVNNKIKNYLGSSLKKPP